MVRGAGGLHTPGVVLHETEYDVDVWVSPTVVRRVGHDAVAALDANDARVDDMLLAASADARVFGSVRTDARVVVREANGARTEAKVIERCRYGAIVAYEDGRIKAVGFRALWASEHQT
jgi:hypothetical protein